MLGMGDLKYALRMLRKNPGFAAAAIGLLALGIGASSVIFTAFNALLLKPLPVRHPEQLVRMVQRSPQLGTRSNFIPEYYDALREHSTTLAAVFGDLDWLAVMNEPAPAEELRVAIVTQEFFSTLGAPALVGRALTAQDEVDTPGTPPAVLSYGFWQRRFHGDPHAIGQTLKLHGNLFAIVGVMPREFNGISADTTPDVRVPRRTFPLLTLRARARPVLSALELAGRVKPGVSLEQAQAECQALWRASMLAANSRDPGWVQSEFSRPLQLEPLEHGASLLRDRFGLAIKLLLGCVGLLLLMVCSNVAGLLLARSAARREEIAIRLAMGATRSRLVRQALTESVLLAVLGSAGGWLLAWFATPLMMRALPPIRDVGTTKLQISLDMSPDRRVLLVSAAIAMAAALLCGLAPALGAARTNLEGILRGARSRSGWHGRRVLVMAQAALCTLLLAGAGLLVRTFDQLSTLNPGFDRDHVVTFTTDPGLSGYTDAQANVLRLALMERVRQLPGVVSVATASRPLMRGSGIKTTIVLEGQVATPGDFLNASTNGVSPEYFDTLRIPILAGRGLAETDHDTKPVRAVVNQAFARRFFPGLDAVGRRVGYSAKAEFEIVGVSGDAKYRSLREPIPPTMYTLSVDSTFVLHVRTQMRPDAVIQPVRQALAALDPALPFVEVHTMAEEVNASAASERLTAGLASVFGLLAALLAAVGIYGLLAYAVAQRRREIGIRMALGARPSEIGRMIGGQALLMAAIGAAIGLAAAVPAARWIRTLLFNVPPADAFSLGGAAAFVLLVSLAAAFVPASRAARVEPSSALRDEN
jgi:predicted permease